MVREAQRASTLIALYQNPRLTSLELYHATGKGRFMLARRLPDLEKLNLVTRSVQARRCRYSRLKKHCDVWRCTEDGKARAKELLGELMEVAA